MRSSCARHAVEHIPKLQYNPSLTFVPFQALSPPQDLVQKISQDVWLASCFVFLLLPMHAMFLFDQVHRY